VLLDLAAEAEAKIDFILDENLKDLERMDTQDPKFDRLKADEGTD
jgi:glutamate-5-semialdehyde dehydrogenase